MKKKLLDIITAVLVVVMVGTGLLFTFVPELNLRDMILDLVGLPRRVFSFSWNREPVYETPLDYFDEDGEDDEVLVLVPGEGINELPMDVLK